MNEEWVKETTTLGLVKELIDCKKTYVEIAKARWWSSPRKWWRKSHKLEELSQRHQPIADELSKRYEGMLWQMSRRVKESGPLTATEWENCQAGIWQLVWDQARTFSNYRRFCGVFWDICLRQFGQFGNAAPLAALRPKFMLRQFVDELDNSDARGLLRGWAYSKQENMLVGKEVLDGLTDAFGVLHRRVLRRLDDLSLLTDGEITPAMARNIQPPYLEYRRWLFKS